MILTGIIVLKLTGGQITVEVRTDSFNRVKLDLAFQVK